MYVCIMHFSIYLDRCSSNPHVLNLMKIRQVVPCVWTDGKS